ncbi:MAG TPA: sce7726 family protein, partial [Nitrospiraceae bacterium]|nr:sce7726 family protein [Nitrospiraceae bacterium]
MDNTIILGDSDIRRVLRSKLLLKHADELDTVIIEELGLCRGQVRVDLSVVNGLLHGYEIKSDRDSLRRLRSQAELYG